MNEPYELPEGLAWKDLVKNDYSWLNSFKRNADIPLPDAEKYKDYRRITVTFDLRRETDGLIRRCTSEWYPLLPSINPKDEGSLDEVLRGLTYYYTAGNMGCGCNRTWLFAEAGGDPAPLEEERRCENEFTLLWPDWLAEADKEY